MYGEGTGPGTVIIQAEQADSKRRLQEQEWIPHQSSIKHAQDHPPQPSSRPQATAGGVPLLRQWAGASLEEEGPLGTN